MKTTRQRPVKRRRTGIVEFEEAEEAYPPHEHCCTEAKLEFIFTWLKGIPLSRHITKQFREGKMPCDKDQVPHAGMPELHNSVKRTFDDVDVTEPSSVIDSGAGKSRPATSIFEFYALMSGATDSTKSSARSPDYSELVLFRNNICYAPSDQKLPPAVQETWDLIERNLGTEVETMDADDWRYVRKLQRCGPEVSNAMALLIETVFPKRPREGALMRWEAAPFRADLVPTKDGIRRVSIPQPDMTYGYADLYAFSEPQRTTHEQVGPIDTSGNVSYPFFIAEFKVNGPLWQASNQCLGAAATTIAYTEQLNVLLEENGKAKVQTTVLTMAANIYEAVLYVSWKEGDQYLTKKAKNFCLRRESEVMLLKKYASSIVGWGEKERLEEIRGGLDALAKL